jgi:predicted transcriptional regulator of viral defense system
MRARELTEALDRWDRAGIWAYQDKTLELMFRDEPEATLRKALTAHSRSGLLARVTRGLYVNPRARSLPSDLLSALVPFLRPRQSNYLSLESLLSEAGWISQIPSRLTVMTTGRSQTFDTPWGVIEFVHTARQGHRLTDGIQFDERRKLHVATPERAWHDLKRVGRNQHLVIRPDSIHA